MEPSFSKNLGRNESNPFDIAGIGLNGKGCPPGKVPIQRKKANSSLHQFSSKYPGQHVSYHFCFSSLLTAVSMCYIYIYIYLCACVRYPLLKLD